MADVRINALSTTATSAASDDYLALDGSANGTRKILATNIAQNVTDVTFGTSGPSAKASIAARAARQGLVFDGTNSATVSVPAFGTSAWTVSFWVNLNSLRNYDGLFGGASGAFTGYTDASGNLAIGKSGVGSITVSSYFPSALKTYLVTITNDGTTATIYRDGVSITTSTSANIIANYTAGIVAFGSNNNANANPLAGSLSGALIYNRALSAAEVVSLYEAGVPSGADYGVGINSSGSTVYAGQSMILGDNSTFTSDTGWWTKGTGVTISSGSANLPSTGAALSKIGICTPGKRYRATIVVTALSGGTLNYTDLQVTSTAIGTGPGTYVFDYTHASTATNGVFGLQASGAAATIDSVTLTPLGLLLAPDAAQAGGGLTWYDTSGNAANITLPASGVTWNVPTSSKSATGWSFGGKVIAGSTTPDYAISKLQSNGALVVYGGAITNAPDAPSIVIDQQVGGVARIMASGTSTWNVPLAINPYGGNVLLGTTTDSANGKLQLASHTTSAGGIGFGTVASLHADGNNGYLALTPPSGTTAGYRLYNSTTLRGQLAYSGTDVYLDSSTGSLILRTGASTTALTLDSSQNATFAGTVTAVGISSFKRSDNTGSIRLIPSSGVSAGSDIESFNGSTSAFSRLNTRGTHLQVYTGTSANTLALTVDDSQRTILSGALRLNNAYTASVVAPTGYVTIQDSTGTTYKVCVLL